MKTKMRLAAVFLAALTLLSFMAAPGSALAAGEPDAEAIGRRLIETGSRYLGTAYEFGADPDRTDAFDCSSFTKHVFGLFGIELPRSSREQYRAGRAVPLKEARVGDLVFFHRTGDPSYISHVGIYAGDGQVLHATASQGVTFSDFTSGYWAERFAGVRRFIP